ncbi:MAG: preprotein translocase subunit YajC [Elusimicrobiota bacterium]|jgi:preprotein translocase subunit YajC
MNPAAQPSPIMSMLPILAIFAIFYFLIIRPQQKQVKEHQKMLDALQRGDRVVTGGGIFGTVRGLRGLEVEVEIADKVVVTVARSTITKVVRPENAAVEAKAS